jgi:hypothetical protein
MFGAMRQSWFTNITITGGNITTSGGYRYHTFTSSNLSPGLTVNGGTITVEYIAVAGGGAGGGWNDDSGNGGGGGAGGALRGTATLAPASYAIGIGAGGTASSTYPGSHRGGNTWVTGGTIGNLVANAGGAGGAYISGADTTGVPTGGGSGGGWGQKNNNYVGKAAMTGTAGQGNAGGFVTASGATPYGGQGGGGAGAVGGNTSGVNGAQGGPGGNGATWLNGIIYAGGASGSSHSSLTAGSASAGGTGGGGQGGYGLPGNVTYGYKRSVSNATPGTANLGGGGGGGGETGFGSNGGSGVVIIRYPFVA